jgi:hypothetical protein
MLIGDPRKNVSELRNGEMAVRVWTIQRPSWWRTLQQRGLIHADGRRLCRNFRPAYNWMMGQMQRRISGYTGAYPVWFWYSPKPDLRHGGHLARGERGMRIELELPRSIVLLSDFETWHCVLNRWHLSLSWRESREWDRKTKGFDQYRGKLPAQLEVELQSTWERVFDIDLVRRTKLWGPVDSIQGVADRVLLSEVREVREFVAR